MGTPNAELMKMARASLSGKWGLAVGASAVYILVCATMAIPFVGQIAALFMVGPLLLGYATFALSLARDEEDARLEQIFNGFKNFGTALGLYYLQAIIVILFTLLLIVPGIIRAIAYAMSYYILADQPHLGPMEVLNESKRMMDGYKMKYFRMMLRFFGLSLLCILTLGIGYLWLFPYMQVTMAKFYDDLKKERGEEEFI